MGSEKSTLGMCPYCGSPLDSGSIILEYEVDGDRRIYADCTECDEPVHPQAATSE